MPANPLKQIDVVGAVVIRDGLVLCAQRGPGQMAGMWEFPGGKVEPGETARAALAREIDEELGCHVQVGPQITTTRHEYDFGIITLTTFYCTVAAGEPRAVEHAEVRWEPPSNLHTLEWAPADIPAVARVQSDFA